MAPNADTKIKKGAGLANGSGDPDTIPTYDYEVNGKSYSVEYDDKTGQVTGIWYGDGANVGQEVPIEEANKVTQPFVKDYAAKSANIVDQVSKKSLADTTPTTKANAVVNSVANGNPVTYPNGVKINPDNAGSETVYEKQDIDGKTYMVGYNVDKKTGAKNIVDVRDEDGLLYDDVTADSTGKLKSVEATTGKTDKWTDANKTKYAGITDYTTADKTTTTPSEYTTPHYDKATGMIIMPDGSKRDRSGRLWVEPTLSQGEKIGSWMADDDTKTYRQQFKDNNFYRSAADTQAGLERAQAIADGTLNADATPITSAATTPVTSTDKTAAKSNNAASWTGTVLGAAQVGLGATTLISDHYNQPDDYDVDPNVAADAARARTAAAFGLEGNDLDMATKSIEAKRRMTAANIINASRGSGAVALSNMQKGTNLANEGMNKLASYDTATKMKKEAYADTLDKVIAKMRQKKSDDAWSAWRDNEKSGAKLLQAGINNVIGAQKYKAMLDAQKARAVTNNSSDWWSASTTTPTQTY
jgi:hypothetical protein